MFDNLSQLEDESFFRIQNHFRKRSVFSWSSQSHSHLMQLLTVCILLESDCEMSDFWFLIYSIIFLILNTVEHSLDQSPLLVRISVLVSWCCSQVKQSGWSWISRAQGWLTRILCLLGVATVSDSHLSMRRPPRSWKASSLWSRYCIMELM